MIYPYKCNKCSITIELERSNHAEADAPMCTPCGEPMSRIFSVPGVKFNAPGFYSTGG